MYRPSLWNFYAGGVAGGGVGGADPAIPRPQRVAGKQAVPNTGGWSATNVKSGAHALLLGLDVPS